MAKRMLSLLMAAVMVLGMFPVFSLTAAAEETTQVDPAVGTPLWSADFDDPTKVYDAANSDTVTNSVWSTYKTSVFNFTFQEKTPGDKYMTIVSGKTDTSEAPFELGSTKFAPADSAFITMDLLRPVAKKDGFKILIHDEDGKALAHLIMNWQDKIQYDLNGGTTWVDSGISAPYGSEWFTLSIVVLQSEEDGEDQLIITCGENTATVKGNFASAKGVAQLLLQAQGNGYNKASYSESRNLDNIAVYAYTPATAVKFEKDAYEVKVGGALQTAAVVTPAVTYPAVKITYSSDNEEVATVDGKGLITGVAAGTAKIKATVTNSDGSTISGEATVTVTGAKVLWDSEFENYDLTVEGQNFNKDTNDWNKWFWKANCNTNGSYVAKLVADAEDPANHFLQITAGADTTETTTYWRYRCNSFANTKAMELSFDVWLNEDDTGYRDNFFIQVHPYDVSDAAMLEIMISSQGYVQYRLSGSENFTGTAGPIAAEKWQNIRVIVIQNEGTANDLWQVYVEDQLMLEGKSFGDASGYGQKNPHAFSIRTSSGSNGRYTNVDTRFDNMVVYEYPTVAARSVSFAEQLMWLEIEKTLQLAAIAAPANASGYTIRYESSNEEIATVDDNGVVTAVALGDTVITATLTNADGTSCTDTVTLRVSENGIGPVWFDDFELENTADGQNYTGSRWSTTTAGEYSLKIVDDPTGSGRSKVLQITSDADKPAATRFNYMSSNFGPAIKTEETRWILSFDVYLSKNENGMDGIYFAMSPFGYGHGYNAVQIHTDEAGYIKYGDYSNSNKWINIGKLSADEWHTFQLVILQNEGSDNDAWALFLDGQLLTKQTTWTAYEDKNGTTVNTDAVGVVKMTLAGDNPARMRNSYLDNMAVYTYIPMESVDIAEETITVEGCRSVALTVTATPETANSPVIYTSSDETVAVVDQYGVVTGVAPGEAVITAQTMEGLSDSVKVTVTVLEPTEIRVDRETVSLPAGAHTYLNAQVVPADATYSTVSFASSDESVVTVDEWGEIVCLKAGTAKIILTAGNVIREVSVTVTDPGVMKTIQVSPNGTSLADALAQIAEINASDEGMTGNIEVVLADGYYYLTETLQMNETHGGTNGYSVIWKAAENAVPVIGGAVHIDGSKFSDADNDGIYTVDLAALGIPKVADPNTMSTTRQLFVDNIRATRARTEGGLTNADFYMSGSTNLGYTSDDVNLAEVARPQDLEFVFQVLWTNPRCGVSGVTCNGDDTVSFTMDQPGWSYVLGKGNSAARASGPDWIENALELLDQPGEWYINEETQILYYMPRAWEDMSQVKMTLPLLDDYDADKDGVSGLIRIDGTDYDNMVHNISFEGITFADTTWTRPSTTMGHSDAQNNHLRESGSNSADYLPEAAITVARANGVCFTGCTFTRLGVTALKMIEGVQNSFIVGNHFYDIAGGAVNIGDPYYTRIDNTNPSDVRMMMKNDDVLNNYIHDIAVEYNSAAAISLGYGPDMNFSYNEIFNMPYSGFHIGYGWNFIFENNLKNLEVSYNFIHDFMGDGVKDGGGIYTLGNSGGDENHYNKIHSNYVKTVLDDSGPLYMDNGATYYEIYNNLVDLSKVTDWSGNTSLSWLQMNSYSAYLKVHDNYATVVKHNDYSTNSQIEKVNLEVAGQWSAGAQAIIDGAGLQSEYVQLRNGHAELIVTNLEDDVDMQIGDSLQISVSYTDGKDKPVSGGKYITAFDSRDPEIAEVSEDGVITAKQKGTAVIRIWFVSNDVLDVIEKTVYVGDEITEVYLKNYRDSERLSLSDVSDGIVLQPIVETLRGRIVAAEAEDVTFTVADASVAKVVNGVLVPVSVGTTSVTVRVEMDGMSGEVTYDIKVFQSKTFVVDYLEDMFNSKEEEWTKSGTVSQWEQVEDTSLTTKLHGWAIYGGRTYENELLTFKLRLDTSATGGWPAFMLRADSTTKNVSGGASGYLLCFGKDQKGIELQRWNGTQRTMIIGNVTNYPPVSGIYTLLHNVDDGQEHLIQVGAMTDDGGTRLVLYVDGVKLFDFLDDSADAITESGYFGIIGRSEIFYLNHASTEDGYLVASVGGEMYNDFQKALDAAKEGQSVKLLADIEEDGILLKGGVVLDLNGQNLSADHLVAFAGSDVIDSVGGGLLKCKNVSLNSDNPAMPVWDEETGGYRLFSMFEQQVFKTSDANGFEFVAKPLLNSSNDNNYLMAQSETNGLSVKVRMSWQTASGNQVDQLFVMKGEDVDYIYTTPGKVISLTVSGAGGYIGKLQVTAYIESETGVIWTGEDMLYKGE